MFRNDKKNTVIASACLLQAGSAAIPYGFLSSCPSLGTAIHAEIVSTSLSRKDSQLFYHSSLEIM
jgi:hypothetical protein